MGLFDQTEKANAAQQIKMWYDTAVSSINQAMFYKKNLENQLDLMKTNSDYTQEDCDEVQTLINQISLQMTYYS